MKRKILVGSIVVAVAVVVVGILLLSSERKDITVGVNQFMQHPLLDDVFKGIKDELNESGLSEEKGVNVVLKNANGDQNVAVQINKQFVSQKVDMIIPLGTPSAQSACSLTKTIPIVFGAITDPVTAGIADSLEKPGGNKTGTSDRWPYEKQVALIRQILPSAKKVGIILNPGESNTEASMKHIRPALEKFKFDIIEVPVSQTVDVYIAAKSLVGRCDAILTPADNTVVSAFESVVKIANENSIPLFAGDIPSVEKGAIATYGVNYYKIGRATGELAARLLKNRGELPGAIPVTVESKSDLIINLKAAKVQNIEIPEDLIKQASKVIR
ncbi:ABC transporter substrate-binding protein [bacterium]|nr:ABC transporter substrate-binding protein [bacterium]